jgi:nitroreductase / dihydropteridine reductase
MSDLSQPKNPPVLLDKLQWRYATKKMDPSKAVPQDKVERIIEAARLAPTSSDLHYTADRINHMFDLVNTERGFTNEGWENYRQMLLKNYPVRDPQVNFEHAARQAYIGLGAALIAAAFEEVDATPMEGFDPAKLDEILKLRERGLRSVAIVPLGYRAAEGDWLVNLKKVRRPREQFVTEVK